MSGAFRNRSITEKAAAVFVLCFLVGFVLVLCIGNYYRAKRAMERQRQRRLAKLAGANGNGMIDSPRSTASQSTEFSDEKQSLLRRTPNTSQHLHSRRAGGHQQQIQHLGAEDLLLHIEDDDKTHQ